MKDAEVADFSPVKNLKHAVPFCSSLPRATLRWEKTTVVLLALVVGIAAVLWAFFADRHPELDDLGLFNPPYMYANYGSVTYPAHFQFHNMYVHPPIHYWVLGVLIKAGIPPYYAEAVPPLFFILLGLVVVCCSRFPYPVKAGLLLAFTVPLMYFRFEPRMRPDTHIALAWFVGLLLLESGRLQGWNPARLFLGSFLVTYASCLNYPISLAWTGVLLYAVWVLRAQRDRRGVAALFSLLGGGGLIGIPYLLLFVVPNWGDITQMAQAADPLGGPLASIRAHLEVYHSVYSAMLSQSAWVGPMEGLLWPLSIGVPLVVISLVCLFVSPATRGLALASLPYPLLLLFVVTRKFAGYLMPEFILYVAGFGVAACVALHWLVGRIASRQRWLWVFGLSVLILLALGISSPVLRTVRISVQPRVHESAIARAAARQMLGPNTLVGGRRALLFYASGGAYYFDVERDLQYRGFSSRVLSQGHDPHDPAEYVRLFDAIAETHYLSDRTLGEEKESLISWYAEGALHLRGFYFSSETFYLNYLYLSAQPTWSVQGYGLAEDRHLVHFKPGPEGNYVFVAAVCGVGESPDFPKTRFDAAFRLPNAGAGAPPKVIHTFVSAAKDYYGYRPMILQRCSVRDEIPLQEEQVDVRKLLATLTNDKPIRFPETLEEAVEERYGPALQIRLATNGWPSGFTVPDVEQLRSFAEPLPPGDYPLEGKLAQVVFRSDMESVAPWRANRYGQRGGFEVVPDGLAPGDGSGKYSVGDSRDHLVTEFLTLPRTKTGLVFFSVWARRPAADDLPRFYVQDEDYSALAFARPFARRADGWTLLAGVVSVSPGQKVRIVVQQASGAVCLLDKALVVALSP